jgi:hypothetical protein
VSDIVLLGDTRETNDSEMVDHRFLSIEELIGCVRLTCFVNKFLDWEDREGFNIILDGIVAELRWEHCMENHGSAIV